MENCCLDDYFLNIINDSFKICGKRVGIDPKKIILLKGDENIHYQIKINFEK